MGEKTDRRFSSKDASGVASGTQTRGVETGNVYQFGPYRLDPGERTLLRGNEAVTLPPKAFDTLVLMVRNSGRLMEKDELIRTLWPDSFVEDGSLSNNIFVLRKALGEDPRYLETVPKRGYRFVGAVRCLPEWERGQREEKGFQASFSAAVAADAGEPRYIETLARRAASALPRRWIWIAAAVALVAIEAALVFWWNQPPAVPVVEAVTQLTDDGEPKSSFTKIVTDGVRVYFNEDAGESLKIAQVAVTGGSVTVILTTVANPVIRGLAPEGSALLAIEGGGPNPNPLWQVPLPGGEPRRLGTIEAQDASFFPDGRILFAREGDLYLAERDGSNPRKLVSVNGVIWDPSISPDGQRIVFTIWSAYSPMSIDESRADGSGLHPILNTSESGHLCCAHWGPDGRYVLFENRHEGRRDLWFLPMKAGFFQRVPQPIQLTNGPLSYTYPVPSRDGKQIFAMGAKERGELVHFDVRTKQFVPFLSGISAFNPTFSRDGNWVAYTSYPDHTLWRSRPDGSERLQLTYPPMQVYYSFISPDGKRVAYGNVKGETYVISMDGGAPQRIVEKDTCCANWAPDGNILVFSNVRDPAHPLLQFLDLRTGKRFVVPGSQDLIGGQWVSEDTLVAAPNNIMKLMIFDVRTQKWSDLVAGKVPNSVVNWAHSPDYKYVYYTTGGAEPKALRIRLADHKVETITSLKDMRLAAGPDDNTQISVAPDGSAIFTRDIGTHEIYALSLNWR